jgi:hypothetical protein
MPKTGIFGDSCTSRTFCSRQQEHSCDSACTVHKRSEKVQRSGQTAVVEPAVFFCSDLHYLSGLTRILNAYSVHPHISSHSIRYELLHLDTIGLPNQVLHGVNPNWWSLCVHLWLISSFQCNPGSKKGGRRSISIHISPIDLS